MAPAKGAAGTKRGTSAAASPKKRSRVDPVFAGIIATLQEADDLSEQCREMLVAMVAPSLSTPKSERHHMQALGVRLIEDTFQGHKKKLIAAVEVAQKEVTDLEGSKNSLMKNTEDAKASVEDKNALFLSAHTAHEEAKQSVKEAERALGEAKGEQKKGDASHAALTKEKAAIDTAYQEHFKAPMEANEGPHHSFLKPFIKRLGLEDSLTNALPSSCDKTKDQRGSFDDLVLTEVGKAFVGKIAAIEQSLAEEATGVAARGAAVTSAEAVLEVKQQVQKAAAEAEEAAATTKHEAETALRKAEGDWSTFEPRVQEATENHKMHDTNRVDFEEGALKDFVGLRDKEVPAPAEDEAAPAGA